MWLRSSKIYDLLLCSQQEAPDVDFIWYSWSTPSLVFGLVWVSPLASSLLSCSHSSAAHDWPSICSFLTEYSTGRERQELYYFHYPTGLPLGTDCVGSRRENESELNRGIWVVCGRAGAVIGGGEGGWYVTVSSRVLKVRGHHLL